MNIHILHDDKFTNGAIQQFEQFYPEQNLYIVLLYDKPDLIYTSPNDKLIRLHIRDRKLTQKLNNLIKQNPVVKNLFVHYLDSFKAAIAVRLIKKNRLNFYWIFYGGDLYDFLIRHLQYDIYDDKQYLQKTPMLSEFVKKVKYLIWFGMTPKKVLLSAFQEVDFFCFWNEYDFELFKRKLKTKAKKKNFIYYNALGNPSLPLVEKKNSIVINHSASVSGNHFSILKSLKNLKVDSTKFNIILPLSYGNKSYADQVVSFAKTIMGNSVMPLMDFLPINEYQNILSEVKIAIFGMRRQEAAGNIFLLINMGAKVFLREENTLLQWLKKRDFLIYSIEKDLQDGLNLNGLSADEIAHNRTCYQKTFNEKNFAKFMNGLIQE